MPGGESGEHGQPDPGALGRSQRAAPGHQLPQVDRARYVLRDGPAPAFVFHRVVHGHRVRTAVRPWRDPAAGADGLEHDLAGLSLIVGEPHPHRPAVAERAQQQVAAGDDAAHLGRWWFRRRMT
ncbi:hypothetical protein [Streptomyces flaveolus]|uniref:hypothetical protein n=1 Tax=Streptomyces flaveolus TaxID=67297 RepID=UPI003F4D77FB